MERLETDKRFRRIACRESIELFGYFYFSHYFISESAPFHSEMAADLHFDDHDEENEFYFLLWIMFRDSAKTTWAKIKVCHCICYKTKRYIKWVGHEKDKARQNLQSIANELQCNLKLIRDFGQLYFEQDMKQGNKKTLVGKTRPKQVTQFITENDVLVQAGGMGTSPRGDLYDQFRPDFYVIDDIENQNTISSFIKTRKAIKYLGELLSGISVDCHIIFLGNYISDKGSVAFLKKKAEGNPSFKKLEIPLVKDGEIQWPGRFVWTNEEARKINKNITNRKARVKSIEQMKEDLGTALFDQEMNLIPIPENEGLVQEEWFQKYNPASLFQDDEGNFYYTFEGDDAATMGTTLTAIDPAVSEKGTADDRVIFTGVVFQRQIKVGKDEYKTQPYYFLVKCRAGKWSMKLFAQNLSNDIENFSPEDVGCESNGVQQVFRELFQQYGISTRALDPDTNKMRRFQRHIADIEFGYFMIPDNGGQDVIDFVDELCNFTGQAGKQDNRVDAFSYFMQMAKEGGDDFFFAQL